jgi:ectoine hydroxylase-related dioxygenase (phytanoyl-CoA dioxygenase family)
LEELNALATRLLPGACPVRIISFNKTENANWTLPWHQDRVIALRKRVEMPGFTNWTNKAGTWHAEPPIELLDRMIFARVHLDPANAENGCLQLALGAHTRGKIAAEDAEVVANAASIEECVTERGDVLFAKALTLHRSSPSRTSAIRCAIRVDYCAEPLPPPLEWAA